MKIVVLDGYTLNPGDLSWDGFKELGETVVYERTAPEQILNRAKDAEIVITNKTPITKETIDLLPKMQYIGVLATGYNVIDIDAAREKGIVVCNIPAYGTQAVAQMTFALLLALCNKVEMHNDAVKKGVWSASKDFCFCVDTLTELAGKTMGIIGFGRIGAQVAALADAFGMEVVYNSNSRKNTKYRWMERDELFRTADVVSLHCPLVAATQGLINKQTLEKMKKTAFLINTSRGQVIVEKDLADALNQGKIAGAALDVLSQEPPAADNPLLTAKNCIITPHIAWAAKETRARLMNIAVENLKAWMDGKPVNCVNG